MLTAARIIPKPPYISKYRNASMVVLLCASALLPLFGLDRLPGKERAEYLSEDQLFRQQSDCQRENHSCDDCHECDCHLHNVLLRKVLLPEVSCIGSRLRRS